ncbi:MAG TPA: type II toxin-antitoxin system RelE/ParE family toxin [Prolixibacteraceae bacterium]|nr:type II toxin-antitoxin system RelE/ParE family toxin [Prolixibacteraceae bacterium]
MSTSGNFSASARSIPCSSVICADWYFLGGITFPCRLRDFRVLTEPSQFRFNFGQLVSLSGNFTYLCSMDKRHKHRTIIFYKDYFQEFFEKQRDKVKNKIIWTLDLIEDLQRVPESYLKHIENTDGLFEIRVQQGSDIFRIFCFFDQGQLVILTNGFQKKTQKTPKQEIDKAIKIKQDYENEKK